MAVFERTMSERKSRDGPKKSVGKSFGKTFHEKRIPKRKNTGRQNLSPVDKLVKTAKWQETFQGI